MWIVTGQSGRMVNVNNVRYDVNRDRPTSSYDTGNDDWAFFTMTDHACHWPRLTSMPRISTADFGHWPRNIHAHYLKTFRQNLQVTNDCSDDKLLQRENYTVYSNIKWTDTKQNQTCHTTSDNIEHEHAISHSSHE